MDAIFFQHCSPFQLQITASIRERPLRATWATIAVPTLPTAAVRGPTLLFVTERACVVVPQKDILKPGELSPLENKWIGSIHAPFTLD